MEVLRLGLDIGSTTAKLTVINEDNKIIFSKYERHHATIFKVLLSYLKNIEVKFGDCLISPVITGSVGMGIAERCSTPFIQEVVAASNVVGNIYPGVSTIIDIGGEDAKIVYLNSEGANDLRMNGNCAGGTGAFIDQMAIFLGVSIEEMNTLALQSDKIYPIASRCGVFSKTDIQNLISKNIPKSDIAASIFHAVAVQTIATLSRGCDINPKILFCGGPLSFIPSLRKSFIDYLHLNSSDVIIPENSNLISAWGAALYAKKEDKIVLKEFVSKIESISELKQLVVENSLEPLFTSLQQYEDWKFKKKSGKIKRSKLEKSIENVFLGIDSGSTTTKIVLINEFDELLFEYYVSNTGDPITTVYKGLEKVEKICTDLKIDLNVLGSCVAGYGEDLIKAAFNLDYGIVETIAHYMAAHKSNSGVSFILDIGGQDMKAMYIENGRLSRIEINEACSSGCGSFIETFAKSLEYNLDDFAALACASQSPCDLGTRCTVFMNSKVKEVLRQGSTSSDIAAGLSYSVIKNCLYKVLGIKNITDLGDNIVVQGGTMRNDSIVRALEKLTGIEVYRNDVPELMGAYGCALYAKSVSSNNKVKLKNLLNTAEYETRHIICHGCENQCVVNKYIFLNKNTFYSGNKCEKVFSNGGSYKVIGKNASTQKYKLLFDRENKKENISLKIGIPRCLGMYEEYPFWHTLFNESGIEVCLSSPSGFNKYEEGAKYVMSDNICFPAKLVHSHIQDLYEKKVDHIFYPYTIFENTENKNQVNSYNCPIVTGYSDVIKSVQSQGIPIDSPTITFKDRKTLKKNCIFYLSSLGVDKKIINKAFYLAILSLDEFNQKLFSLNHQYYQEQNNGCKLTVLLAGRPYHTDPLIQHKISEMISGMGITVITEDIIKNENSFELKDIYHVTQWAYMTRLIKAAKWVAEQDETIQFVQLTSFGCGPDSFLVDEIKQILNRKGKNLTLLKIDDVNNIGSIKLRVRSIIESLKFNAIKNNNIPFSTTKKYLPEDRERIILAPYFTDYISPLIPSLFELAGYKVVNLPKSNYSSVEYGLKYANNEICYPATLIIGDIIQALKSGIYEKSNTSIAITQTGGQCRASNYLSLIKKALVEAGYSEIPVISVSFGSGLKNDQPGFKVNWLRILPMAITIILYSDCISKFYHASVIREKKAGEALKLKKYYLEIIKESILRNDIKTVLNILSLAAKDFSRIINLNDTFPKVGIVGEIFLKFNSYANKEIENWFIERKIEVIPPTLINFFMQSFVNQKVNYKVGIENNKISNSVYSILHKIVNRQIRKINQLASVFPYYSPVNDIFKEAEYAKDVVSLSAQFGEGWLLPAEIIAFQKQGINNIVSVQPFGCIANHIVVKGVEKRIKSLYPQLNFLSIDYDGGVSEVNIINRLLLFIDNLK